jgi:hypothetical protein
VCWFFFCTVEMYCQYMVSDYHRYQLLRVTALFGLSDVVGHE